VKLNYSDAVVANNARFKLFFPAYTSYVSMKGVFFPMEAASRILHSYLHINRRMAEELRGQVGKRNLTFPQTMALYLLHEEGPMPISNLATATGSANSTISGVVDRLEKMGLIRRVRSEQDRRVIYVATTDRFENMYEAASGSMLGSFEGLIGAMNEDELDRVESGLRTLESALDSSED
jgi:DNA-binding MarR family transcriptional regulator